MIELSTPKLPKVINQMAKNLQKGYDKLYSDIFAQYPTFRNNKNHVVIGEVDFAITLADTQLRYYLDNSFILYSSVAANFEFENTSNFPIKTIFIDEATYPNTGLCKVVNAKNNTMQMRLGKALQKLLDSAKSLANTTDYEVFKQMIKTYQEAYESDMQQGKNKKLKIVITKDLKDIAAMSTKRDWASCTNLYETLSDSAINESALDRVEDIIRSRSLVAYLCKPDDTKIDNPVARKNIFAYWSGKSIRSKFIFVTANDTYTAYRRSSVGMRNFDIEIRDWVSRTNKQVIQNRKLSKDALVIYNAFNANTDIIFDETGIRSIAEDADKCRTIRTIIEYLNYSEKGATPNIDAQVVKDFEKIVCKTKGIKSILKLATSVPFTHDTGTFENYLRESIRIKLIILTLVIRSARNLSRTTMRTNILRGADGATLFRVIPDLTPMIPFITFVQHITTERDSIVNKLAAVLKIDFSSKDIYKVKTNSYKIMSKILKEWPEYVAGSKVEDDKL